ncbi:MAG: hypothetical protein V3V99_02560 [candidate division Zixibacteria bacterium]
MCILYPDDRIIISLVDYYITKQEKTRLHSGVFAFATALQESKIKKVFHIIAETNPQKFVDEVYEDHAVLQLIHFKDMPKIKGLFTLADKYPGDFIIIKIIDNYYENRRKRWLSSRWLASDTGFPEDRIKEVFLRVAGECPSKFDIENTDDSLILKRRGVFYDGIVETLYQFVIRKWKIKKKFVSLLLGLGIGTSAMSFAIFESIIKLGIQGIFEFLMDMTPVSYQVIDIIIGIVWILSNTWLLIGSKRVSSFFKKPEAGGASGYSDIHDGKIPRIIINDKEYQEWQELRNWISTF